MDGADVSASSLGEQGTGFMHELLRLYRDRDARDAKIRSLEQAVAEARHATPAAPAAGLGQLNWSALQVQQLEESLQAHHRQLEEQKTTNAAQMATIDSMQRAQDESYAIIEGFRKIKETQEATAKQLQEQNTTYQLELDHLRARQVELAEAVADAQRRRSEAEEQLQTTIACANAERDTLREELLRLTHDHAVLEEKLQQMEHRHQAGTIRSSSTSEQSVQTDILEDAEVQASACHMRREPWAGDNNLDFKVWLRRHVLGLTDATCMHPIAHTSSQAVRRYLFAKRAIETVRSLGWETEALDVFRVPEDSREFRNATFGMNAVREAAGVPPDLWEADVDTFTRGVDGRELILAWLRGPEDPALRARFGNMTRDEFARYKRDGSEPHNPHLQWPRSRAKKTLRGASGTTSPPSAPAPDMFAGPSAYVAVSRYMGDARRRLQFPTDMPGVRKRALTDEQCTQVDDLARELMINDGHAEHLHLIARWRGRREHGFHPQQEEADPTLVQPKRKRMSVDKRLAMHGIDDVDEGEGGIPRSSKRTG